MADLIVYLPSHGYSDSDVLFVSWLGYNCYVQNKSANSFKISLDAAGANLIQYTTTVTDGYVRKQNLTGTTTISGLDHLNGETVLVTSGGNRIGTSYVVSGGEIEIPQSLTTYQCGLPYTMKVRTTRLEVPQAGTIQSRIKNINEVVVRHIRSKEGQSGQESEGEAFLNDLECEFFTESQDKQVQVRGGFADEGYVVIQSQDPFPFTTLATIISFSVDEQR